jgi:hypothetical protein
LKIPRDSGPEMFWHAAENREGRRYDTQLHASQFGLSAMRFGYVDELFDCDHGAPQA